MYENEFNNALQAIAENVDEAQFDSIIEGAGILIEENHLSMDEAVSLSAAMLFNEDAISADSYAVTSAVMDEFAATPMSGVDALNYLAENMTEENFNRFVNEAFISVPGAKDRQEGKRLVQQADNAKQQLIGYGIDAKQAAKDTAGDRRKGNLLKAKGNAKTALAGLAIAGGAAGLAYGGKKLSDAIKQHKANVKEYRTMKAKDNARAKLDAEAAKKAEKTEKKELPASTNEAVTLASLRAIAESYSN